MMRNYMYYSRGVLPKYFPLGHEVYRESEREPGRALTDKSEEKKGAYIKR